MVSPPKDFKSFASAGFAILAYPFVFCKKRLLARQAFWVWRRHPDLNRGIRVLQTLALPLGYGAIKKQCGVHFGAGNETRTRDIHLGKVTLYH